MPSRSERLTRELRRVLLVTGAILTGLGLLTLLTGAGLHTPTPTAAADSDARFAGGVLVGYGLIWIHTARPAQPPTALVRLLAGGLLLSGLARILSLITVGHPGPIGTVQMVIELLVPTITLLLISMARRSVPATTD